MLCVIFAAILVAGGTPQEAEAEAGANAPAEVCDKVALRAKLGACFRSTPGAIECLSDDDAKEASKALIMCRCISQLEEVRGSLKDDTLLLECRYKRCIFVLLFPPLFLSHLSFVCCHRHLLACAYVCSSRSRTRHTHTCARTNVISYPSIHAIESSYIAPPP